MKFSGVLLVTATLAIVLAGEALAARNVELLHGTVRSGAHSASGRAAVVLTNGRRVLTLRNFRIASGPKVRVYLVPRSVRGDGDVRRDFKDLGALKGSRGNQQYAIGASVDLRRYRSVIFWCVPFTTTLARANLTKS
jgi:Electron transfer DM13